MSVSEPCLEEGEIADSCESANETTEKMEMTGAVKLMDKPIQALQSTTDYRAMRSACVGSSDDSSSYDDEQEFNTSPVKAKRGCMQLCSSDSLAAVPHNEDFLRASQQFHKKQSQDVWKKVALEQTMDESIRKVNTIEKDSEDESDDRGVESYNYKHKAEVEARDGRERIDYGEDTFGDNEEEVDELDAQSDASPEANICDIESFGVDGDPNKQSVIESQDAQTGLTRVSRKRTIKDRIDYKRISSSTESGERRSIRHRLGCRRNHVKHKFSRKATFNFQCKETDEPDVVSSALVEALGEPQYQLELFQRVVNTVGVKKAIELYYITENIEQNGGMLVLNGDRRRSPGGVFLQMLKNDSAVSQDMIKQIFPYQRMKKKQRKKKAKEPVNDMSSSEVGEKELPSKAEVLLRHTRNKVAMDLGESGDDDHDLDKEEVGIEIDFPDV